MNIVTSEANKHFFSYIGTLGKKKIIRKNGIVLVRVEKNKKESGYMVKIIHNRDTIADAEFFDCYESAEEFYDGVVNQVNEDMQFFEYRNSHDLPCAVRASDIAGLEVNESNFSNEYVLIFKIRKGVPNQVDFFDYEEEADYVAQDLLKYSLDNCFIE